MEINYVMQGEKGKQCKDCKNFEVDKNTNSGKCMSYPVQAEGSCKLFEVKR